MHSAAMAAGTNVSRARRCLTTANGPSPHPKERENVGQDGGRQRPSPPRRRATWSAVSVADSHSGHGARLSPNRPAKGQALHTNLNIVSAAGMHLRDSNLMWATMYRTAPSGGDPRRCA